MIGKATTIRILIKGLTNRKQCNIISKEKEMLNLSNYNADSMESLGLLGGVRAKPASIGLENHNHPFLEILGNGLDESGAGYGNEFIIKKYDDGSVSIRDFGRGVPMDKNAKGEYAYEKVFNELWSGRKYNNNEGESNYKFSLGTNGI